MRDTQHGDHAESSDDVRQSLAEKLNRLCEASRPAGRQRPLSNQEIADAINDSRGEQTISAQYLWLLRNGKRTNPTLHHLEALAGYFGVPTAYLVSDDPAVITEVERDLNALVALRDANVRRMALRANELSPANRQAVLQLIENLRASQDEPDGPR